MKLEETDISKLPPRLKAREIIKDLEGYLGDILYGDVGNSKKYMLTEKNVKRITNHIRKYAKRIDKTMEVV